MACYSDYTPRFQKQLVEGDPWATLNCTCYSAAMLADYATCGKQKPTGEFIRRLTGDTSGGTRLSQVDAALGKLGIKLVPHYGMPRSDFVDRINDGHSAILQGWYDPIRRSRFSGSETFRTNHAIFVPPGWEAMDPLADGRRGLYEYHKETYPKSLLKEYAGKLNVSAVPDREYRPLGNGYVYAAFSIDHPRRPATPVPPPAPPAIGPSYYGVNKMIVCSVVQATVFIKKGQPLYREARSGAPIVTRMSRDADVSFLGLAASGWRAVRIGTGAPFSDGEIRPVIAYVPASKTGLPKPR